MHSPILYLNVIPHQILLKSFESLPDDEYHNENFLFRKRRYSTGIFNNKSSTISWETGKFIQSTEINTYVGGITRYFKPLRDDTLICIEKLLVINIIKAIPFIPTRIGVHQIRVLCESSHMGIPTPEGFHQDGFDFICVYCVNHVNIAGGVSIIKDLNNKIIEQRQLASGDMIIFNDKLHYHYVSPIVPINPNNLAYRDVMVFTFS